IWRSARCVETDTLPAMPSSRRPPRARGRKAARTAAGKPITTLKLATAERNALAGVRERTEEGPQKAGRAPPSGRKLDSDIRDVAPFVTEDEKLLAQVGPQDDFTRTDPWRLMRIMGEFIEGFDTLASVVKGVSIFGSARTGPGDAHYAAAEETARLL